MSDAFRAAVVPEITRLVERLRELVRSTGVTDPEGVDWRVLSIIVAESTNAVNFGGGEANSVENTLDAVGSGLSVMLAASYCCNGHLMQEVQTLANRTIHHVHVLAGRHPQPTTETDLFNCEPKGSA